jgi:translation elongation factor EF-G
VHLPCRKDEQIRGITMKSSSISLLHVDAPYRKLRDAAPATVPKPLSSPSSASASAGGVEATASASASAAASASTASVADDATAGAGTASTAAAVPGDAPKESRVHYLVNVIDSPGHVDFSRCTALTLSLRCHLVGISHHTVSR